MSERFRPLHDNNCHNHHDPNGDSKELFGGFFPAATTIPSFETSFDPDRRVFTLRLHNTCLESGGAETDEIEEWIGADR